MDNLRINDFSLAVIIPNYNKEKYLHKCLDSVLSQSLLPDEVIIVDDCSTDNSQKIITEYKQKYSIIKPLFLKENGGVSNARNKGLETASTRFVTFIDSDDFYYNKEKLKNEMALIKSYDSENKDIVAYSVVARVNEEGRLLPGRSNRKWHKYQFIKGKSLVTLVSMAKQNRVPRDYCIKKQVLESVGAYSFYKNFYEDLDLLMRIAEAGIEYYCTYEYGTAYRQTEGGLSKREESEHINTIEEIKRTYYQRFSSAEKLEYCIRVMIHKKCGTVKRRIIVPLRDFMRKGLGR